MAVRCTRYVSSIMRIFGLKVSSATAASKQKELCEKKTRFQLNVSCVTMHIWVDMHNHRYAVGIKFTLLLEYFVALIP